MSVQTTNEISKVILKVGVETAAVAWAATAIASPIGALGGAIFGAVRSVTRIPLSYIGERFLHSNHPQAEPAARVLAAVIVIFGSFAAAWGALAAAGISITVSHMASLAITSLFTQFGIELFLACLTQQRAPLVV